MADELLDLIWSYRVTQCIHVAASLGIADQLADGPRTSDDLAEATGANADALQRLLRALAAFDLLREEGDGRFSLTGQGERLRTDHEQSLHAVAAFVGRPYFWETWGRFGDSIRTGENGFRLVHGMSVWDYRAQNPRESELFDAAMTAHTRIATPAIVAAYDFGRYGTVVDVGGGRGTLLAAILDAHPGVLGVLFDRPHVVDGLDLGDRVQVVGGSFFDEVPPGGDAYVLKWILHDWEDDACVAILSTCRRAMRADARLLVVERELRSRDSILSDLNMLVMPGGRERTRDQYAELFAAAGFRLADVHDAGEYGVFEGAPEP